MTIRRFEDIDAWQMARRLCDAVCEVLCACDAAKAFALKDQLDRSSGSAMDNIAEGFDGGSNAEFIRFLGYAQRSCCEVQSQLYRAKDRELIDETGFARLYEMAAETHSKIGGFIRYLKAHPKPNNQEQRTKNQEPVTPTPQQPNNPTTVAPPARHTRMRSDWNPSAIKS